MEGEKGRGEGRFMSDIERLVNHQTNTGHSWPAICTRIYRR